jgi:hypothetical protein
VHQGTQLRTCHLREFWEPLHYNSPDCPVCQRSNGYQGPTVVCRGTVKCYSARLRTQKSEQTLEGAPASEQDLSGAPPDYPVAQLSEAPTRTQRPGDMAGAPDCPVHHTTAASTNGSFGGWGYKYPQPPHFKASKFSAFKPHTRALDFIQDTNKEIKSSPKSKDHSNQIVTSERDNCVHLSSCAWIAFLLPSFLFPTQL